MADQPRQPPPTTSPPLSMHSQLSNVPEEPLLLTPQHTGLSATTTTFGSYDNTPTQRSPYPHPSHSASASTFSAGSTRSPLLGASQHPPRSPGPNGPRRPSARSTPSSGPNAPLPSVPLEGSAIPRTPSVAAHALAEKRSASSLRKRGSDSTMGPRDSSSLASSPQGAPPSALPSAVRSARRAGGRGASGASERAARGKEGGYRVLAPALPHDHGAPPAPSTIMYWSPMAVHGLLPNRGLRAHSVNLVDQLAWVYGGTDEKGCWSDVWCFDTETFQWSHPETIGEHPPPTRAHTATLLDRKILIYGGGERGNYYREAYVLDTVSRRWAHARLQPASPEPPPRRAHTAVLYHGRVMVFGGGNGTEALNDCWALDPGRNVGVDQMRWEKIETVGRGPKPRGYHTANVVQNYMFVIGGSDGRECFSDIWVLDLESREWREIVPETPHRRLSHTSTQVGSYLFLVGGHDGTNYLNDTVLFSLVDLEFEPRATLGKRPSPRGYHAALLADSRLIVLGGFNGHDVHDDVYALELAAAAYLPQVTSFSIELDRPYE